MAGEFLRSFFEERGQVQVKPNGEADVLCPFEHAKGFERRPSAHVNIDKAIFHCKTCMAEGRFSDGGLSEANFIAKWYGVPYSQAIKMMSQFEVKSETIDNWQVAVSNLTSNAEAVKYLNNRGITLEAIHTYKLGYVGSGIVYPVFVNGILLDKRTYNMNPAPGEPKIKSESGASTLLFPFDHWKDDPRDTFLTAGENDTLLARIKGFNAVTTTFGEGSFPDIFLGLFRGKRVHICYDCDEAGKQGAQKTAFKLHEAGAMVFLMDLGLQGTKEDKDVTDFFIKHGKTAEDFQAVADAAQPYTGEMFQQAKNEHYPLVDLWQVNHGEFSGKRISSRVIMMGKFDMPMETPTAIEWKCNRPILDVEGSPCQVCPLKEQSGWWILEDHNLNDVLKLVEVDEKAQESAINRMIGLPPKCPGVWKSRREKKHVQKVIFAPDAETEDELSGFRATEHYSYVIGLDLEDGQRYRIYFRRYPHPKTQQIVSVVDRVEESDNAVNTFKLTPETITELSQFQGHPVEVMQKRLDVAKRIVGPFAPASVVETVNILYHSILDFRYAGKLMKGHPEILIIGPSRTGKTDTAKKWMQFLGLGNLTECKTATTAGLLGGADKLPSGAHRIRWGKIPRNHKGLLLLDELSGMPMGVMSTLTALRSERIARLEKIVNGAAPAKVRLGWISNPRVQSDGKSRNINLYPTGVQIVLDLIGSDEDVARFDAVVILPNIEVYISPFTSKEEAVEIDNTPYRNLVYWAWSRTADQVLFFPGVEEYIWQVAQELNEKYDTDVKFFGAEAHKKLARIAVSVAACCFSHDGTGERVLVQKEHVDWARDYLVRCYDNDVFRLPEYAEQQKMTTTTNEEVNNVFAGLVHGQAMLMKTLSRASEISLPQLRTVCGLDSKVFDDAISNMVRHGLVETTKNGVMPTLRFRKARDAYANSIDKQKMTPLSQQGGAFI
jgi:hypothetical protein